MGIVSGNKTAYFPIWKIYGIRIIFSIALSFQLYVNGYSQCGSTITGSVGGTTTLNSATYVDPNSTNNKTTNFTTLRANVTITSVDFFIPSWQGVSGLVVSIQNSAGTTTFGSGAAVTASAAGSTVKRTVTFSNLTLTTAGTYRIAVTAGSGNVGAFNPAPSYPQTEGTSTINITGVTNGFQVFNNLQFSYCEAVSPPSITTHPSSQTICAGSSVTFSVTATGSSLTYQWRKGGTNISGATGSSYTIPSVASSDAGNFDVVVSNGTSVTSNAATLTVNALPAAPGVSSPVNYCLNEPSSVLSATGSNLTWYQGSASVTGSVGGTSWNTNCIYNDWQINACANQKYTFFTTHTSNVIINSVDVKSGDWCSFSNVVFRIQSADGSVNYCTSNAISQGGVGGGQVVTVSFSGCTLSTAGNYRIGISSGSGNFSTVNNSTYPQTEATGTISITGSGNGTGTSCEQMYNNLRFTTVGGLTILPGAPTPSTASAGTQTYSVTQTVNGCTSPAATITVNVSSNPYPTLTITNPPTACSPNTVNLTAASVTTGSTAGLLYSYWTNAAATNSLTNPSSVNITGTYYIKGTTAAGCANTKPVTATVTTVATPTANDVSRCGNGMISLTASGSTGNYRWYLPDGGNNTANPLNLSISVTTEYEVVAWSGSCESPRVTVNAYVYNSPIANISAGGPTTFCSGSNVTLNASTGSGYTYQWKKDGADISGATNSSYAATEAGSYSVFINVPSCGSATSSAISVTTRSSGTWLGQNTSWENNTNWCGGIPTSSTNVIINSGLSNYPVISASAQAQSITISSDASLTVSGSNNLTLAGNLDNSGTLTLNSGQLALGGNFNNSGTFNANSSNVLFSGSSLQTISGNNTFHNITINNPSGVTINSGTGNTQSIKSVLTLTQGILTTNNNLRLISNATSHGMIAGTGTGNTSGLITMQRYIPTSGYHYLSGPIPNLTMADWSDNFLLRSLPSYNNYWWYNETNHGTKYQDLKGWTPVKTTATAIENLKGYAIAYNVAPLTMDVTGEYNHGYAPPPVTLTRTVNAENPANNGIDGWHLVGNPYPSALDWDAPSGWTRTNIYNAIYFWDPVFTRYVTYVNGVGVNNGSRYIPAWQGFFIRVDTTQSSGVFGLNNSVRITSVNPSFYRLANNDNIIKLRLNHSNRFDEAVIRFIEDASEGFDGDYDAYKMGNDGTCPDLIINMEKNQLSVNTIPFNFNEKIIPLTVKAKATGNYIFDVRDLNFNRNMTVMLFDKVLGLETELSSGKTYSANITKGDIRDRFFLIFRNYDYTSNGNGTVTGESVSFNSFNSTLEINFKNLQNVNIELYNTLGNKIFEKQNITASQTFSENFDTLPAGIYFAIVSSSGKQYSGKVFLGK